MINRRKFGQETVIVVDYRVNLGLLKHNLGNPDMVGIVRLAPREISLVDIEPIQYGRLKR